MWLYLWKIKLEWSSSLDSWNTTGNKLGRKGRRDDGGGGRRRKTRRRRRLEELFGFGTEDVALSCFSKINKQNRTNKQLTAYSTTREKSLLKQRQRRWLEYMAWPLAQTSGSTVLLAARGLLTNTTTIPTTPIWMQMNTWMLTPRW
jgi:hypothetical protein